MSLRVWVPFTDGTARDLGLAGLKFTFADSTKTSSNNSGKIGKCFYNNTLAAGGLLSTTNITLPVTQSWFCWAKFDLFYSSSSLTGVISQHDPTNKKNMGITVKYVSATTGYLSCSTGTGSSRTYNTYTGSTLLNTDTWYHLGFTYDGSTIKFYVNGVLDGTKSYSGQSQSAAPIRLFGWNIADSSYAMKGYLNDVRIYDNCLTPAEVKDLSKGLIGHWKLNDYEILRSKCANVNWNLIYNVGLLTSSSTSDVSYSVNNLGQITYTVSAIPTVSRDCPANSFVNNNIFIENHKYYIDFNNSGNSGLTAYVFCNNTNRTYGNSSSPTIFTVNSSDLSTSYAWTFRLRFYSNTGVIGTYHCYPVLIDLTKMFGSGNEPTVELFKEMFPLHYYPYDSGTTKDLRLPIPDISGNHHNLTVNGNPTLSNDSVRYNKSCLFGSGVSLTPLFPSFLTNEATVSMWVKLDQLPPSSPGRTMLYTSWYGFSCEVTSEGKTYFRTQLTSGSVDSPRGTITAGNWIHWVGVKSSTGVSLYLNGTLVGTTSNSNNFNWSSVASNAIGAYGGSYYTYGKLSDVRLYATALSASDIQYLYSLGN